MGKSITKSMAEKIARDNAADMAQDEIDTAVAFWAVEAASKVSAFTSVNRPDDLQNWGYDDEKGRDVFRADDYLTEFFRFILRTYDVRARPSSLLEKAHTAKWVTLQPHVVKVLSRSVSAILRNYDHLSVGNASTGLPEDLFEGRGQAPTPTPPDDFITPDDYPETVAQAPYKHIIKPAVFAACYARETPKSPGNTKLLANFAGLGVHKRVGLATQALLTAATQLKKSTPNFVTLLDDLATYFSAQHKVGAPVGFQPILIVGEPGIGKTRFVNMVAACMGVQAKFINLSGARDGMKLKGLSPSWSSAAPGEIARAMADSSHFNPVIVLDEIDKAGAGYKGQSGIGSDIHDLLLPLLERETSSIYEDDYIQTAMDLSGVSWIATCNSLSDMPPALLSRFDVYHIDPLTREQQASIISGVHAEIVKSSGFAGLNDCLSDDVAEAFMAMGLSMRELRREIYKAQCRAVLRHTDTTKCASVLLEDILQPQAKQKPARGIGFGATM